MPEPQAPTVPDLAPENLIGAERVGIPGDAVVSTDPAHPERVVWSGGAPVEHVDGAVGAARAALAGWASSPVERRVEALRAFQRIAAERVDEMAALISAETGKAHWDCLGEAKLLGAKIDITLDESARSGRSRVTGFDVEVTETRAGRCRFRPHGVMGVVGPFNFPAHLPNGHIAPALLTGNTVVLKPSDKAPAVGQALASMYREALASVGAPEGVVNLVQGGAEVAVALVTHDDLDGILFTGSWPVGRRILEANLDRPGRVVALEMGGNNGAIVMPDADLRVAAIECARAAFITTGQRCTCTRRLVVHKDAAPRLLPLLAKIASNLVVGDPRGVAGQPVFMGPIVSAQARDAIDGARRRLAELGARTLLDGPPIDHPSGGHYLGPTIVEVERFTAPSGAYSETVDDAGCDVEFFGPLLRVSLAESYEDALEQANATRFGLAASIFTGDGAVAEDFLARARAGCVNVNTGTAGASSKLPFGGLGLSGNHRPAGAFALDYTAYPVASLVETGAVAPVPPGMRFDEAWLGD